MKVNKTIQENYLYWPADVLARYIQTSQHQFVKKQVPALVGQFGLVCGKHKKVHPEITGVNDLFSDFAEQLRGDVEYDFTLIYPYIYDLVECHHKGTPLSAPGFSSISSIVETAREKQKSRIHCLDSIIELTFTFNRFASVNLEYNALVSALNVMADDLQLISHLKFNILFPKAAEMENTVNREKMTVKSLQPRRREEGVIE